MKKLICLLLALSMCFALCACGGSEESAAPEAAPEATPEAAPEELDFASMSIDELKGHITTVNAGKLTVATSPDFAPYEFYAIDADGNYTLAGFDMALAQYVADFLGLELEVLPMAFDGTIAELANHNVDMGMAGYSPKPDRLEVMDFSTVYITGGQSFVCLEANKDMFPDLAATNNSDLAIAAQTGSIQVDLARENSPEADIIETSAVTDIIAQLVAGKVDGAYIETMVAEAYQQSYPELCLVLEVPYDAEGSVIGINKGNAALLAGVNMAIDACKASGEFDKYVKEANDLAAGDILEGLLEG